MIQLAPTRLAAAISAYTEKCRSGLLFCAAACYNPQQEKGGKPMIRKRINTLLNKMSDEQLKRIYKYIKYIYIHR